MPEPLATPPLSAFVSMPNLIVDLVGGSVLSVVAKTCRAPTDRVKLLLQTQGVDPRVRSGERQRYTGVVDCVRRVRSEQGIAAFWLSNTTNCGMFFPTAVFNLAFKDAIKALFPFAPGMGAFAAGLGSQLFVYPLSYAHIRLACDCEDDDGKPRFSGFGDCLKKTVACGGFGAMYTGFGLSLAGVVLYRAVFFALSDTLRGSERFRSGLLSLLWRLACSQFVAITAGWAIYPLDTIRCRLQLQADQPKGRQVYAGATDCLRKVVQEEGITALFAGFSMIPLRAALSTVVVVLFDMVSNRGS